MTTEENELLLRDLSARLSYGVICKGINRYFDIDKDKYIIDREAVGPLTNIGYDYCTLGLTQKCKLSTIRPYLRPLESMTDEDLISYAKYDFAYDDIYKIVGFRCTGKGFINIHCSLVRDPEHYQVIFQKTRTSPLENWRGIDWLNSHHFDFRGLIKKGLALKAPEDMYNFLNNQANDNRK
jgi:hypothetical protein